MTPLQQLKSRMQANFSAEERPALTRTSFAGFPVTIENPIGSTRHGVDADGTPWKTTFKVPYGYINRVQGLDNEGLDIFLGPDKSAKEVHLVNQQHLNGDLDEQKVLANFPSAAAAKAAYLAHHGNRPEFFRSMTSMPVETFQRLCHRGIPGSIRWKRKHRRPMETEAIFEAEDDKGDVQWRTIGASGKPPHGGVHVEMNVKTGEIDKGPKKMEGENVADIKPSKPRVNKKAEETKQLGEKYKQFHEKANAAASAHPPETSSPTPHPKSEQHAAANKAYWDAFLNKGKSHPDTLKAKADYDNLSAEVRGSHVAAPKMAEIQSRMQGKNALPEPKPPTQTSAPHPPPDKGEMPSTRGIAGNLAPEATSRSGKARPPLDLQQELQSALGFGKLTIPTHNGQVDPHLAEAYKWIAERKGIQLGDFQVNPKTGRATATVDRNRGNVANSLQPVVPKPMTGNTPTPAPMNAGGAGVVPDQPAQPAPVTRQAPLDTPNPTAPHSDLTPGDPVEQAKADIAKSRADAELKVTPPGESGTPEQLAVSTGQTDKPGKASGEHKDHPMLDLATGKPIEPPAPEPEPIQQEQAMPPRAVQPGMEHMPVPPAEGLLPQQGEQQAGSVDPNAPLAPPVAPGQSPTDLHHKMLDVMHTIAKHHAGEPVADAVNTSAVPPVTPEAPAPTIPTAQGGEGLAVAPQTPVQTPQARETQPPPVAPQAPQTSNAAPPSKPPATPPVAQGQPDQPDKGKPKSAALQMRDKIAARREAEGRPNTSPVAPIRPAPQPQATTPNPVRQAAESAVSSTVPKWKQQREAIEARKAKEEGNAPTQPVGDQPEAGEPASGGVPEPQGGTVPVSTPEAPPSPPQPPSASVEQPQAAPVVSNEPGALTAALSAPKPPRKSRKAQAEQPAEGEAPVMPLPEMSEPPTKVRAPSKASTVRDAKAARPDAGQDEHADEQALNEAAGAGHPFTFHKKLPGEVEKFIEDNPRAKGMFNTTENIKEAGGADAFAKLGDRYFNIAKNYAGTTKKADTDAARQEARNSPDHDTSLRAHIADAKPLKGEAKTKTEMVDPKHLELDQSGTIHGIPVRVTQNEDEETVLKDGSDLPETPVDAIRGPIPFDKGSLKKEELGEGVKGDFNPEELEEKSTPAAEPAAQQPSPAELPPKTAPTPQDRSAELKRKYSDDPHFKRRMEMAMSPQPRQGEKPFSYTKLSKLIKDPGNANRIKQDIGIDPSNSFGGEDVGYAYRSPARPLNFLSGEIEPGVKHTVLGGTGYTDDTLLTNKPLSPERIAGLELETVQHTPSHQALTTELTNAAHGTNGPAHMVHPDDLNDNPRGMIIAPSANEKGKWQATRFDKHGFSGHATHPTRDDAIREAANAGMHPDTDKTLDAISQGEDWKHGAKVQRVKDYLDKPISPEANASIWKALHAGGPDAALKAIEEHKQELAKPPATLDAMKSRMAANAAKPTMEKMKERMQAPEPAAPPTPPQRVDPSRQLGMFAKDAQGNAMEIGERPGQANLFDRSGAKGAATASPPQDARDARIAAQYDPAATSSMFPAAPAATPDITQVPLDELKRDNADYWTRGSKYGDQADLQREIMRRHKASIPSPKEGTLAGADRGEGKDEWGEPLHGKHDVAVGTKPTGATIQGKQHEPHELSPEDYHKSRVGGHVEHQTTGGVNAKGEKTPPAKLTLSIKSYGEDPHVDRLVNEEHGGLVRKARQEGKAVHPANEVSHPPTKLDEMKSRMHANPLDSITTPHGIKKHIAGLTEQKAALERKLAAKEKKLAKMSSPSTALPPAKAVKETPKQATPGDTVKWNTVGGKEHSGKLVEMDNGTAIVRTPDGKELGVNSDKPLEVVSRSSPVAEDPHSEMERVLKYNQEKKGYERTKKYPAIPLGDTGITVSPDDLSYQLAHDAHAGSSHFPENRAVSRQNEYVSHMRAVHDSLAPLAKTPEQKAMLKDELERYRQGYLSRKNAMLSAQSRTMSPMIAGPSNFPVRSNQKKLDTADRRMNELLDFQKKAQDAMRRKISPAEATSISSDDPNAPEHLQAKIAKHEKLHSDMKKANAAHAAFLKNPASLDKSDLSDALKEKVRNYKPAYSWEPHPFPPYSIQNNAANIKRMKDRVEQLTKNRAKPSSETTFEGGKIHDNADDNRIQVFFDKKPDRDVIDKMKANGFKWAPSVGAWQRFRNEGSRGAVHRALGVKMNQPSPEKPPDEKFSSDPFTPTPLDVLRARMRGRQLVTA